MNQAQLSVGQEVKITWRGQRVVARYLEWSTKYNLAIVEYEGKRLYRNIKEEYIAPASPASAQQSKFSVAERFTFMIKFAEMVAKGLSNSLIVAGEGGIGKSHTVLDALKDADPKVIKGFSTPKSLYRALFENSHKTIVFDDCDSVLKHATAINILKAALDSKPNREISWLSEQKKADDDLPTSFIFTGQVIFLTNYRLADLPQPILSRALMVDLSMTPTEKIERMRQIDLQTGLTAEQTTEVINFIDSLKDNVSDLNLRTYLKVCQLVKADPVGWRKPAEYML